MKTKLKFIIIGIVLTSIVFGTYQSLMYQCGTLPVFMETPRNPNLWNCLEIWENQSEQPQPRRILPDPICFVITATSGETGSAVSLEQCFPLNDFEKLGCTKPMLEHTYKYTNLLDEQFDGTYIRNLVGLPDGTSEEEYDECTGSIFENRIKSLENQGFGSMFEPRPPDGFTPTEIPVRAYQHADERPDYVEAKLNGSITLPKESPALTDKQLDDLMDKLVYSELDRFELPIASIAIDYDGDILVLWTPNLTIGNKVKEIVGDTAFVLLFEEAPPRWETGDPEPESMPEPEPEPIPEPDSLQRQKQQQAKLHVQEIIMTDYRGNEHQIKAINEYGNEFETEYFLEQFILFTNKQNYEKDDLINFVFVEWGYQQQECTSPKVEVYLRPYENYDKIEKISEWQKSEEDGCYSIDYDSDGYLIMNAWPMPGIFEPHETCTIPGEYRITASNLKDESKKQWGYYTCQQEKLVGEPQPWMELPN